MADIEKTGLRHSEVSKGGDKPKKGKYGAVKVEIDGYVFHSLKEGERYKQLRTLRELGLLLYLLIQYEFQLNHRGNFSYKYKADFVYAPLTGKMIVEDTKGFITPTFKKKAKLMKRIYNIAILIT